MPIYTYQCPNCKKEEDISHSMDECDSPSEETQLKTSCNSNTCDLARSLDKDTEVIPEYGLQWKRVITAPTLLGMSSGSSGDPKASLKKKQRQRKIRSKRNFRDEVLPTLDETPKIKKHFKDKLKDI